MGSFIIQRCVSNHSRWIERLIVVFVYSSSCFDCPSLILSFLFIMKVVVPLSIFLRIISLLTVILRALGAPRRWQIVPRFSVNVISASSFSTLTSVSKTKPSCLNQALVHFIPRAMLANTTSILNPISPTYQTFNRHLLSEDSLNIQSITKLSLLSEGSLNIQSNTSRLENYLGVDTRVCLQRDNVREYSLRNNVRDRSVNYNNHRYINCSNANINPGKCLQFCIWNAQSLRNKTSVLHDYLCHKDIDICAITESWFKTKDTVARAECTPPGYTIKNHSRSGRAGGGIALIYKSTLSLVKVAAGEKTSFQFVEYTISSDLRSGADKIKLVGYLPSSLLHRSPRHSGYISRRVRQLSRADHLVA